MSHAEPTCLCLGIVPIPPYQTRFTFHYVGAAECLADPFDAHVFKRDGVSLSSSQGEVTLYRRKQGERDIGVTGFVDHQQLLSAVKRSIIWRDVLDRTWIVCRVDHLGYDGFAEVRLVRHLPVRRAGGAI